MYRRILVPLDGSNSAEYALPRAMAMAGRLDSPLLDLVTVAIPFEGYPPPLGMSGGGSRGREPKLA